MVTPFTTQGAYIIQYVMHKVAEALGIDEAVVHQVNMLNKKHLITNEAGERMYKTPAVGLVVPEDMFTAPRIWNILKVCSKRHRVDAILTL